MQWGVVVASLVATIVVFWALTQLSSVHELPPRRGRRRMRVAARIIGAWQLTIAVSQVVLWGASPWAGGVLVLALMGVCLLVVSWIWTPTLLDALDDLDEQSRVDVERWLEVNEPGQHRR